MQSLSPFKTEKDSNAASESRLADDLPPFQKFKLLARNLISVRRGEIQTAEKQITEKHEGI